MLDVKVSIENKEVVINGLQDLAARMPGAIKRGLHRIGGGLYAEAFKWLSGLGGAGKKQREDYVGFRNKTTGKDVMFRSFHTAGAYPVPVRSGHLRGYLDWLDPGQSKSGPAGTFTAGQDEVVVFDSASYAAAIFMGRGSSAKFGPRDALRDALDYFNHGAQIQQIMGEEVQKEINKSQG